MIKLIKCNAAKLNTSGQRQYHKARHSLTTLLLILPLLALVCIPQAAFALQQSNDAGIEHILVIGDSISAAYGIETEQGWVSLLQQELTKYQPTLNITNASISGDTSEGGLHRLPRALEKFEPDLVIIELGGNDGLRGGSIKRLRANLESMATLAQDSGADVLILGMRIPSNYGAAYTEQFFNAFTEAAENTGAALVPFFLEPIAETRSYFQADGVHPTADAQPLLMELVLNKIKALVAQD